MVPEGLGTALKPAFEPICLARKPLSEKTIAANVLKWGTGALNIDGCRISTADALGGGKTSPDYAGCKGGWRSPFQDSAEAMAARAEIEKVKVAKAEALGRWPANIIHDGSEEVLACFPETAPSKANLRGEQHSGRHGGLADLGAHIKEGTNSIRGVDDNGGSAARFFYSAKADDDDRLGSGHPTVKPVDLMQWLVRLVTPKGALTLDPFAGTGTTGEAAYREGCRAVLIEREGAYCADIVRRMALAAASGRERRQQTIIAKGEAKDAGPLFGGPLA